MRIVNDAFVLPDPPSWLEAAAKSIRKGLKNIFPFHEEEFDWVR